MNLYVLGLKNGLYRHVTGCPASVAIMSLDECKRAKAGYPNSYIEPYDPFNIYPTEFGDDDE